MNSHKTGQNQKNYNFLWLDRWIISNATLRATSSADTPSLDHITTHGCCCSAVIRFGSIYRVSQKKSPLRGPDISRFFHKRLRICNRFFTHLLIVPIFATLQIFIQLSPILTKLCHIKRDYAVRIICAKCPKHTKTRTFRRLRKSLIALLIVVCGK